jgi:K+-transporting ATPase ATPase C chain
MKTIRPALVLLAFFLLVTGIAFPAAVAAIAQVALPWQARGSFVEEGGKTVGSVLIAQPFAGEGFFHPRPSASAWDPKASGGTNLGPMNPKLLEGADGFEGIRQLAEKYRVVNGVPADVLIPADAVTRSASGLDPHISVRNAELQAPRVARARGKSEDEVKTLIRSATDQPFLGLFGEARVNVLKLNLSLTR